MAATKRPALRKQDRVTLSRIKSVIPAYGGKPFVGRDTVLTVSHLTGTGSKRNPWHVVVTDGTHFWHLEPDDVQRVDNDEGAHSTMKRRGTKRELNDWLDRHGYRHAHARVSKVKVTDPSAQIRAVNGRFHFQDRSKLMSPEARERGPRWTAFVNVFGHDVVGEGARKPEALQSALSELPEHLKRHFA